MNDPFLKNLTVSMLSTSLGLTLGGCSTPSETFDCPAGKGVGCTSLSEVNHLVDQGRLGTETGVPEKGMQSSLSPSSDTRVSPAIVADDSPSVDGLPPQFSILLSDTLVVQRIPEERLRVWIAPFQDDSGNLHEGSVIHTVLQPGYWQLKSHPPENPDVQETFPEKWKKEEVD